MKFYIQSLFVLSSVALVAACGTKSANSPGAPRNVSKAVQQMSGTTAAKIKVLSAESFEKIHADENDNSEFVAVDGQVIEKAAADQADPKNEKARCITRIQNIRVQDGQEIDQIQVLYARSENRPNLYYANLSRAQGQGEQGQGFALVCAKAGSAVTAAEVKTALKGIVDTSI